MAHVDHYTRAEAPFQRDFINALGRQTRRSCAIVIRRVDVCASVTIGDEILHRPSAAIGIDQVLRPASKKIGDGLAAGCVVEILNLRRRQFAGRVVLDGDAEVDEA